MIAIASRSVIFNIRRYLEMGLLFVLIYAAAWVIASWRYCSSVRRLITIS